jgi:hypothetical protein
MATLITLDVAKAQLRITDAVHDADIQRKADQASAIVVDYLKSGRTRWTNDPIDAWTPATVDPVVQSAILDVLSNLYEHRGDDWGVNQPDEELWNGIRRRLARMRDPALA